MATGVTCPSGRYHPAIIAQAAATLAIISDGRFTLGAGAGERLNEHVAELPNPVNFEAATASITADQVRKQFACGPDVSRYLEVAQPFVDAGFDRLVTLNAGPDPDGFMDFFARDLAEPLRKLTPSIARP